MRHWTRTVGIFAAVVAAAVGLVWWLGSREVRRTNLSRDLVAAVIQGDAPQCRALLREGADPNVHNDFIAEHLSPWMGFARMVRRVLGRQGWPARGRLAISIAIQAGRVDIYHLFLRYHANPREADFYGRTALWTAAEVGRVDLIKEELARGADINHRDTYGRTPMRIAATNDHENAMQALAEAGAPIDLMDAVLANDVSLVRDALNRHGPTPVDETGRTPIDIACGLNNLQVVLILLEHGADVKKADNFGYTPLMWAAGSARKQIVGLLLGGGADAGALDKSSRSALHWVAANGNEDHTTLYRLLVAYHAPIDQRDSNGRTALMQEATVRTASGAAFLLQRGANPEIKDNVGNSARSVAGLCGNRELVERIDSARRASAIARDR
jgi:ankyrin repeat protein